MTQSQIYICGDRFEAKLVSPGSDGSHGACIDQAKAHSFTTETVHQHDPTLSGCLRGMSWFRNTGDDCFNRRGSEPRLFPLNLLKPYLKSNKNDFNDATAIAEAGSRGTMRCVPLKSHEQLALQATHRSPSAFHRRTYRHGQSDASVAAGIWAHRASRQKSLRARSYRRS